MDPSRFWVAFWDPGLKPFSEVRYTGASAASAASPLDFRAAGIGVNNLGLINHNNLCFVD